MNLRIETREALGPARHRHLGHRYCRSCLNEDAQDLETLGFQVGEGGFRETFELFGGQANLVSQFGVLSRDLSKPMDKRAVQYQQGECAARVALPSSYSFWAKKLIVGRYGADSAGRITATPHTIVNSSCQL